MNNTKENRNILTHRLQIVDDRGKRLQGKKPLRPFAVLVFITAILVTPLVVSSLTNTVIIPSTGRISGNSIIARSGSPADVQAAVNSMNAAGGGTVYVPAGNFSFDFPTPTSWSVGVTVYGGVNVIGAGINNTILRMTHNPTNVNPVMFYLDGSNGKPIRISGITFKGYVVDTEDWSLEGIEVDSVKDFRIDHSRFEDFSSRGVGVGAHSRGVIDHCEFDNPYKDNPNVEHTWGYGIIVWGDYTWESDINTILGKYDGLDEVTYIEDCTFRRTRHAIAANAGAHYVARHNYFTEMIMSYYGSYIDAHGGTPSAVGTRCVEIYDNIIEDSPTDNRSISDPAYWGQYLGLGIGIRGGGGVIFNNTIKYCRNGIRLYSDFAYEQTKPKAIWIWNNNFINVSNPFEAWQDPISITENVDYFLYAKSSYMPYTYPHPLTLTP